MEESLGLGLRLKMPRRRFFLGAAGEGGGLGLAKRPLREAPALRRRLVKRRRALRGPRVRARQGTRGSCKGSTKPSQTG